MRAAMVWFFCVYVYGCLCAGAGGGAACGVLWMVRGEGLVHVPSYSINELMLKSFRDHLHPGDTVPAWVSMR